MAPIEADRGPDLAVIDTATPFLTWIVRNMPDMERRALKSTAMFFQKEIKAGIRSGSPGGVRYKDLSGVRRSISGGKKILKRTTKDRKPLARLANAVGWKHYPESHRVVIGWLSKSSARLGAIQEKGKVIPITTKMRRMAASGFRTRKGLPLPGRVIFDDDTRDIRIPARPTIGPMYEKLKGMAVRRMEDEIWKRMHQAPKVASRQRKYDVKASFFSALGGGR